MNVCCTSVSMQYEHRRHNRRHYSKVETSKSFLTVCFIVVQLSDTVNLFSLHQGIQNKNNWDFKLQELGSDFLREHSFIFQRLKSPSTCFSLLTLSLLENKTGQVRHPGMYVCVSCVYMCCFQMLRERLSSGISATFTPLIEGCCIIICVFPNKLY